MNECKLCGEPMSVPFRYCSESCALADQEPGEMIGQIEVCPDCKTKLRFEDIERVWYCARCYYEKPADDEDDIDTMVSDLKKDGIDIDMLCDKVLTLINNEKDSMKNE